MNGFSIRMGMILVGWILYLITTPVNAMELSTSVAQSLTNRPEVISASYGTAAARERVGQAYAGYLPTINLRATQGREGTISPSTQARLLTDSVWMNRRESNITLHQNLFDGFRTSNQVTSSQAGAKIAAWKTLEVAELLGMRAVESYLNVLKTNALYELGKNNLDAHNKLLDLVQQREKQKVGSRSEVNQAQSRVKRAESSLAQSEGNIKIAEATFKSLFGMGPDELEEPDYTSALLPDYKTVQIQAMEKHPAIAAAKEGINEARARVMAQNAAYSPVANLILSASKDYDKDGTEGETNIKSAMFEVTFNLFSGTKDTHIKREAAFMLGQAESALTKSQLDITEKVANAFSIWQTSRSLVKMYTTQVEETNKVREAYLKQFTVGKRTLLDLLDSENELFIANENLINERYKAHISLYRAHMSYGNLLTTLKIALPDAAVPLATTFTGVNKSLMGFKPKPDVLQPKPDELTEPIVDTGKESSLQKHPEKTIKLQEQIDNLATKIQ